MFSAFLAALNAIAAIPAILKDIADAQRSDRLAKLEANNQALTKAIMDLGSAETLEERRAIVVALSKASNS